MRHLAVLAVLATAPAWASDDAGDDRPSSVEVALAGTNVRMTARFALEVEGPGVGMNVRSFSLPAHGVITAGSLNVEGKRHRLRLEHADVADRDFDALALKPGRDGERAWAFIVSGSANLFSVDVLAPRSARVVVELALDVATCFYRDARYVELPASWWERVPAARRGTLGVDEVDVATACHRDRGEDTRWIGFASRHLTKRPPGADPSQARALARALSVAQPFAIELQSEIDRLALAVNSVWSLFAQWGGSGGYEDLGGFGTIGLGRFGTSRHDHAVGIGHTGRGIPPLDLRRQLQPALAACRAGDVRVSIRVETTREEIVDVAVDTDDTALRDCIAEAVWDLTLRIADAPEHATTRVTFGTKR